MRESQDNHNFKIFSGMVRRPREDIGRKNNNVNIPYVRNHDPVRTQSLSRTYAIMIPYVRNHDSVRTQYIPYVRNHDPVRTQSWSRTYAIKISYVRNHDHVRTQSWSRTNAIMIPYVRNHYHVRTQSWSRTYAIMIAYVRNYYLERILNCFIFLTYYAIIYQGLSYAYISAGLEFREAHKGRGGGVL